MMAPVEKMVSLLMSIDINDADGEVRAPNENSNKSAEKTYSTLIQIRHLIRGSEFGHKPLDAAK